MEYLQYVLEVCECVDVYVVCVLYIHVCNDSQENIVTLNCAKNSSRFLLKKCFFIFLDLL